MGCEGEHPVHISFPGRLWFIDLILFGAWYFLLLNSFESYSILVWIRCSVFINEGLPIWCLLFISIYRQWQIGFCSIWYAKQLYYFLAEHLLNDSYMKTKQNKTKRIKLKTALSSIGLILNEYWYKRQNNNWKDFRWIFPWTPSRRSCRLPHSGVFVQWGVSGVSTDGFSCCQ